MMKIVGLAGESGTGKSTIAAHLTTRGGVHVDADIIGHEVLESNASVRDKIRVEISADVFYEDGRIDRRRLGAVVFRDEEALKALGEIIHPEIEKECQKRISEIEKSGVPFVVIDGALLLESEMPFAWDLMIALQCNEVEQFKRLMAMGGRTEDEVRSRLKSQRRIRDSLDRADVVVDTCRPKDEVLAEIDALIDDILELEIG
jgi:dephospho-CoA kinase